MIRNEADLREELYALENRIVALQLLLDDIEGDDRIVHATRQIVHDIQAGVESCIRSAEGEPEAPPAIRVRVDGGEPMPVDRWIDMATSDAGRVEISIMTADGERPLTAVDMRAAAERIKAMANGEQP